MILQFLAVLGIGLMCGSELNVAAIAHPTLNHQSREVHTQVRSSFARLLGGVMPYWMAACALLNILMLLPFNHLNRTAWDLAVSAFGIQFLMILFSLAFPVPINNRIAHWTPDSLPSDWEEQEHLWDIYHWVRTCALILAFALLALSLGVR
jgi:uncharacterized membrane protein